MYSIFTHKTKQEDLTTVRIQYLALIFITVQQQATDHVKTTALNAFLKSGSDLWGHISKGTYSKTRTEVT